MNSLVTFPGMDDAKRRIAAALQVSPGEVSVRRSELDIPGAVFRCFGRCKGARFFAKVYLGGPHSSVRRIPAFVPPRVEAELLRNAAMPFGGCAESERNTIREIESFLGDAHIPRLLGCSLPDDTLVFEEIAGSRMDRSVPWTGRRRARLKACADVLSAAGAWLRKLHDTSLSGYEELQPREIARAVGEILCLKGLQSTRYASLALAPMEDACWGASAGEKICVPLCIQHGDFSLPNLVWDAPRGRLWVIDVEHSVRGNILHDLASLTFNLRSQALYPLRAASTVMALEEAFWAGYGAVNRPIRVMASAIATARVFYHLLPKLATRRQRRGWMAGATGAAYARFFEPAMVRRLLKMPAEDGAAQTLCLG